VTRARRQRHSASPSHARTFEATQSPTAPLHEPGATASGAVSATTAAVERLDAFMDVWNAHDVDAIVESFDAFPKARPS
jgi:hypothetical protein